MPIPIFSYDRYRLKTDTDIFINTDADTDYSPKEPMIFERNQNPELLKCQFLFVSTEQELLNLTTVS